MRQPMEMQVRVFSYLSPTDLSSAMLVCREWSLAAASPSLWAQVMITLNRGEVHILSCPRLASLTRLTLTTLDQQVWRAVARLPHLKELCLKNLPWEDTLDLWLGGRGQEELRPVPRQEDMHQKQLPDLLLLSETVGRVNRLEVVGCSLALSHWLQVLRAAEEGRLEHLVIFKLVVKVPCIWNRQTGHPGRSASKLGTERATGCLPVWSAD